MNNTENQHRPNVEPKEQQPKNFFDSFFESNVTFVAAWVFGIALTWCVVDASHPDPIVRVHFTPAAVCDGAPSALQPTVDGPSCSLTGFVTRDASSNPFAMLLSHKPRNPSRVRISTQERGDGDWVDVPEKSVLRIESLMKASDKATP